MHVWEGSSLLWTWFCGWQSPDPLGDELESWVKSSKTSAIASFCPALSADTHFLKGIGFILYLLLTRQSVACGVWSYYQGREKRKVPLYFSITFHVKRSHYFQRKMKYNIILAYVWAASSFPAGWVSAGRWWISRKEERAQACCMPSRSPSIFRDKHKYRSPHHCWGSWVHFSRLIAEGFHNMGNLKIKRKGCIGGFCLARSAPITRSLSGGRLVYSFCGAYCPVKASPASNEHHTLIRTPCGCANSRALCLNNRVHGTHGHRSNSYSSNRQHAFPENWKWPLSITAPNYHSIHLRVCSAKQQLSVFVL